MIVKRTVIHLEPVLYFRMTEETHLEQISGYLAMDEEVRASPTDPHDDQEPENIFSNPWDVDNIDDFRVYSCPECSYLTPDIHPFKDHALENHPLVSCFILNECHFCIDFFICLYSAKRSFLQKRLSSRILQSWAWVI